MSVRLLCLATTLVFHAVAAAAALAAPVTVVNPGFEDTSGQSVFNEFTFGEPTGWSLYDPMNLVPSSGVFTGTLLAPNMGFFNNGAPEGDRVSLLFNSTREGDGEYGFQQTLAETVQANTRYELLVEVGNIASGTATNGTFFNLDEFPGYRIDLMAGGVVVAQDVDSLSIPEAEFATSTITFTTGDTPAELGLNLGIRLVNLNQIPAGFTQATSPDLEVDFDNIRLTAVAVPEPGSLAAMAGVYMVGYWRRRRARRA